MIKRHTSSSRPHQSKCRGSCTAWERSSERYLCRAKLIVQSLYSRGTKVALCVMPCGVLRAAQGSHSLGRVRPLNGWEPYGRCGNRRLLRVLERPQPRREAASIFAFLPLLTVRHSAVSEYVIDAGNCEREFKCVWQHTL